VGNHVTLQAATDHVSYLNSIDLLSKIITNFISFPSQLHICCQLFILRTMMYHQENN